MSETIAGNSPRAASKFLQFAIFFSGIFSLAALGFVAVLYLAGGDSSQNKRVLGVQFFQHGLVQKGVVGSGWAYADADGLHSAGERAQLLVPAKFAELADVNLTIDFSYTKKLEAAAAGRRTLQVFANDRFIAEWRLRDGASRTETITVPYAIREDAENIRLMMKSIPEPGANVADASIVLHSIMVYLD